MGRKKKHQASNKVKECTRDEIKETIAMTPATLAKRSILNEIIMSDLNLSAGYIFDSKRIKKRQEVIKKQIEQIELKV